MVGHSRRGHRSVATTRSHGDSSGRSTRRTALPALGTHGGECRHPFHRGSAGRLVGRGGEGSGSADMPTGGARDDVYVHSFLRRKISRQSRARWVRSGGGSGAVVVRVATSAAAAEIIWSAATARSSPTTTNNTAEYNGLLVGLKEAAAQRWAPLEVVGDSSLILGQMQDYRPPKAAHLLGMYAEPRRLADTLGVTRWNHHLRASNRMADTAANIAMDTRASSRVHHSDRTMLSSPISSLRTLHIGKKLALHDSIV